MGYTCGRRWTNELLAERAKEFNTRGEFQLADPSAYTSARRRGILDDICKHMFSKAFSLKLFEVLHVSACLR